MLGTNESEAKKFFRGFLGGAGQAHIDKFCHENGVTVVNNSFVTGFWNEQKTIRGIDRDNHMDLFVRLKCAGYSNTEAVLQLVLNEMHERLVNSGGERAIVDKGLAVDMTFEHDGN